MDFSFLAQGPEIQQQNFQLKDFVNNSFNPQQ
jgi:hypothetical protein